eukprot:scaffold106437_cov36-Phaeocystis_antarctica.AAC.1
MWLAAPSAQPNADCAEGLGCRDFSVARFQRVLKGWTFSVALPAPRPHKLASARPGAVRASPGGLGQI